MKARLSYGHPGSNNAHSGSREVSIKLRDKLEWHITACSLSAKAKSKSDYDVYRKESICRVSGVIMQEQN